MGTESRLIVCFKNGAEHFLKEFVGPSRHTKRPELSIPFRDVGATHGRPSIPFCTYCFDDGVDFRSCHAVHGLRCRSWGERAVVWVEFGVGTQVQVWVVQVSVDIFERQSTLPAVSNDLQYCFGVTHLAHL